MTYAQFLDQFTPVLEAFPRKFPQVVLERIHLKVDDLNPLLMRELCNEIIDRCEHAPRTAKVMEFANLIRARNHEGLYEQPREVELRCVFCNDLRTIRAVSTDGTHETLMLCECAAQRPDKNDWKLPTWSREWGPLYRKESCPIQWFKPETLAVNEKGIFKLENLNRRKEYWRAKVEIAEEFWKHQKGMCV